MEYGVRYFCVFAVIMTAAVWATLKVATLDQIPSCKPPSGVEERSFPKGLPVALRDAIKNKLGEVVPPGEKFDSTDVVFNGKNPRASFVWVRGTRWVVATEHGGRVHNNPIFAFDITADSLEARLIAEATAFPDSICATALKQIEQ